MVSKLGQFSDLLIVMVSWSLVRAGEEAPVPSRTPPSLLPTEASTACFFLLSCVASLSTRILIGATRFPFFWGNYRLLSFCLLHETVHRSVLSVLLLNLQEEDEEEEEVPAFRLYGDFLCGVFFPPLWCSSPPPHCVVDLGFCDVILFATVFWNQ